VIFLE
jgi:hypothetical protein